MGKKIVALIGLAGIAGVGVVIAPSLITANNQIAAIDQRVDNSVGAWQSQLQRRFDLLPNAARTAEAAGALEKGTQIGVAQGRAGTPAVLQANPLDIANNPELQKQLIEAQAQAAAAVTRVNAAVEKTPTLQSVELFRDTMKMVEGTENRIQTARRDAIIAIGDYNLYIRQWPGVLSATLFGYHKRPAFVASSQAAPELFTK